MAYEKCPKCGGRKHQLGACRECGYTRRSNIKKTKSNKKQKYRVHKAPTGTLPEFGKGKSEDLFDTGRVVTGGGVGVGKGKK